MNRMIELLDEIEELNNIDSEYYFNSIKVPRVTKILSTCIHSDSLMYWANSLGFKHKSYSKTLTQSANIGTQAHNSIDHFLSDNSYQVPLTNESAAIFAYNSFLKWYNILVQNNDVEVLLHEHKLVCKYFGGTLDGLYKINRKIYLVDYKTSNHITYRYCLQLAAYIYMLRVIMNITVDGCVILQLSKNDISFNEYVLNFDNPIHAQYINECERAFLSLVYAYYNINIVENGYKNIDWGVV